MTDPLDAPGIATVGAEPESAGALFVHATGFCSETLFPLGDELATRIGPFAPMFMDQRGHGASTPHPGPFDWNSLATDVLDSVAGAGEHLVGVGHSSGGAAIARAEILKPGTFAHLILIEPIVFPGPYEVRDIPLSIGAERRRRSFESRQAAFERFHGGPFGSWDTRALDLYLDHGFHETPEGWTLRCEPATEAEFYRQASNVDTWDRIPEITCPVTVLSGEHSTSHVDPYLSMLVDQFNDAHATVLDGVGHLAPMENPPLVAEAIEQAMTRYATIPTLS